MCKSLLVLCILLNQHHPTWLFFYSMQLEQNIEFENNIVIIVLLSALNSNALRVVRTRRTYMRYLIIFIFYNLKTQSIINGNFAFKSHDWCLALTLTVTYSFQHTYEYNILCVDAFSGQRISCIDVRTFEVTHDRKRPGVAREIRASIQVRPIEHSRKFPRAPKVSG